MFNHKKIEHLERDIARLRNGIMEEIKSLRERVRAIEKQNKKFFGGDPEDGCAEIKPSRGGLAELIYYTFSNEESSRGLWDKLLDYLGIEYWEDTEKRSGFRKKTRKIYKRRTKRGRPKKKSN